ncbi:MAG: helix-turn-helix transcriptional regulator [Verrucomicrobiaceae bacterium]|nr:helix-turn-helix transcriptional regulator [Verrucomicrobiaceae bacterium]
MRHKPSFSLTPAQVICRCREEGHRDICAGQVLALRACMMELDWNISELADHSHVSRPMLSELLAMKKIATADVWDPVAECLGMRLHAFDLLAQHCLDAELSL